MTLVDDDIWQYCGIEPCGERLLMQLREGLPYAVLLRLAQRFRVHPRQLRPLLGMSVSTLRRRRLAGIFTPRESDRLYQLVQVFEALNGLFAGDSVQMMTWMTGPLWGLGGIAPQQMLATPEGVTTLLNLIGRLEHGVFS